jgi:hypothetical protein
LFSGSRIAEHLVPSALLIGATPGKGEKRAYRQVGEVNIFIRLTLERTQIRTEPEVRDITVMVYICLFNLLFFIIIVLIEGTFIQENGMDRISRRKGYRFDEQQKEKSNRRF